MTTFIACSHGTRSEEGRATIRALVDRIAASEPGLRVEQAFVDVEEPAVADVAARVSGEGSGVVVPLLLSTGFHTRVDIARAVKPHPTLRDAAPLGPHPLLADVLRSRIDEAMDAAGLASGDHVVLAAAGSSDPAAEIDVERMRALVQERLDVPVTVGYAAGAQPRIADAVAAARAAGATRVVAASYVLAPGYFADVVRHAGADVVSEPLGADPRVARVAIERYRDALAASA